MTRSTKLETIDTTAVSDHYWEHGWVAVPHVFSAEEVDHVADVAAAVSQRELAEAPAPSYTVDVSGDGRLAPRKIDWPFLKHDAFRAFVLDERLERLVAAVLGPSPCLIRDQLFMKPPHFGSAKPHHQENAPLHIEPADGFLIAWVALDDVDEENGCLRYIDGSHRAAVPHTEVEGRSFDIAAVDEAYDLDREVLVPIEKGGVIMHHALTLHASAENRSDRWRRAYSSHWVTEGVTARGDALDYAYSRRIGSKPLAHSSR